MKKAVHVCLGEEPEMELDLTRTESASFYFTGIQGLPQYLVCIRSLISIPLSSNASMILYKQVSNIRNNLCVIAGVVHAPFMIFLLTIFSMSRGFCTRVLSLQWRFRAQPPNLIPSNISGYTVCSVSNMLRSSKTHFFVCLLLLLHVFTCEQHAFCLQCSMNVVSICTQCLQAVLLLFSINLQEAPWNV